MYPNESVLAVFQPHLYSRTNDFADDFALSLSKLETNQWNETLVTLNQWMIDVKHDKYDSKDILTILFVRSIFNLIISKHTTSILFVSGIESILQYILHAKNDNHDLIDTIAVDDFIQNESHSMEDILLLNGEFTKVISI